MKLTDKKILIINTGDSWTIDGTITESLDLHYNLKEYGIDSDIALFFNPIRLDHIKKRLHVIFCYKFYFDTVNMLHSQDTVNEFLNTLLPQYDIIFVSVPILYYDYGAVIRDNAKIISYISTRTYLHLRKNQNLAKLFYSKKFFFLYTDFAQKELDKHKGITCNLLKYYVPLSEYRLQCTNTCVKYKVCYDNKNYELDAKYNHNFNVHHYQIIKWRRRGRDFLHKGLNLEIKGKLPFEFNYFGKKVQYDSTSKMMDDGFTDYMKLFGLDDNHDQTIQMPKAEIEKKLVGMKNDDLILQLVCD